MSINEAVCRAFTKALSKFSALEKEQIMQMVFVHVGFQGLSLEERKSSAVATTAKSIKYKGGFITSKGSKEDGVIVGEAFYSLLTGGDGVRTFFPSKVSKGGVPLQWVVEEVEEIPLKYITNSSSSKVEIPQMIPFCLGGQLPHQALTAAGINPADSADSKWWDLQEWFSNLLGKVQAGFIFIPDEDTISKGKIESFQVKGSTETMWKFQVQLYQQNYLSWEWIFENSPLWDSMGSLPKGAFVNLREGLTPVSAQQEVKVVSLKEAVNNQSKNFRKVWTNLLKQWKPGKPLPTFDEWTGSLKDPLASWWAEQDQAAIKREFMASLNNWHNLPKGWDPYGNVSYNPQKEEEVDTHTPSVEQEALDNPPAPTPSSSVEQEKPPEKPDFSSRRGRGTGRGTSVMSDD